MRLKKIQLTNFKRFTDLTIDQIPATSKLVLLIGANGSGKSCVFDAFNFCYISRSVPEIGISPRIVDEYYLKSEKDEASVLMVNSEEENIFNGTFRRKGGASHAGIFKKRESFYGRTSFRQLSRLTNTAIAETKENKKTDNPIFFIDKDNRFENDLTNIYKAITKDIFKDEQSIKEVKEKYIHPINRALENIFEHSRGTKLKLLEIIPPFDNEIPQITFQKGAHKFHYNYLSAGEKEVFNILINLLSRTPQYQDTIYYVDELDLHLNTKLQFNLLKEITENWIPKNCQLWTASHSLGFIEYARQSGHASIIDFDDLDFDIPQVLTPVPKENPEVYEIAVGKEFLSSLFKEKQIIFVENKDRELYGTIGIDKTVFVSDNNRNSVFYKTINTNFKGLVDRDWLSDDDVEQIKQHYPNLFMLEFYSIENYLYHPDNLLEYHKANKISYDKDAYVQQLNEEKNKLVDDFILRLSSARMSYPYFKQPNFNDKPLLQNRFKNKEENFNEATSIGKCLKSDVFEIFYPFLPMKDYCTGVAQRQNISKTALTKTKWFKKQMEALIKE